MARKPKTPLNMSTLLQSTTGTLAQIQAKTNSLTILADIVRQICPDLPEEVWHIANFRQDTLIIEVKSPVWSQRLQFERNKICQALVTETQGHFNKIEIKVNPHSAAQANQAKLHMQALKTKPATHYSLPNRETSEQLLEIASHAPKGLKEKLEKLAKASKKRR